MTARMSTRVGLCAKDCENASPIAEEDGLYKETQVSERNFSCMLHATYHIPDKITDNPINQENVIKRRTNGDKLIWHRARLSAGIDSTKYRLSGRLECEKRVWKSKCNHVCFRSQRNDECKLCCSLTFTLGRITTRMTVILTFTCLCSLLVTYVSSFRLGGASIFQRVRTMNSGPRAVLHMSTTTSNFRDDLRNVAIIGKLLSYKVQLRVCFCANICYLRASSR